MVLSFKRLLLVGLSAFLTFMNLPILAQPPVLTLQDGQVEFYQEPGLVVSRDGRYMLTYDRRGEHNFWDVQSGKLLRRFKAPAGDIGSVDNKTEYRIYISGPSLSADGRYLVTEYGGMNRSYILWDTQTGNVLRKIDKNYAGDPVNYFSAEILANNCILAHVVNDKMHAHMVEITEIRI